MPGTTAHEDEVRESIDQVVRASQKMLDTDERPVKRDQHPKQHGCVRARFIVDENLGDVYSQGLFNQAKVYDAWIRFSNGGQKDDRKPDAHGMAVKLMDVDQPKVLAGEPDGRTIDFVMVDHPTFFMRDARESASFSALLLKASGKEPSRLYSALGFFLSGPAQRLVTLSLLSLLKGKMTTLVRLIRFASKRIANPLTTRYSSATPYRFGDTAMKFSVVPAEFPGGPRARGPGDDSYHALAEFLRPAVALPNATPRPAGNDPDCLREALVRTLNEQGAVFLFQVQRFENESVTPIEDPTVEWSEDVAPFKTVARIWIPKQSFDTPGQVAFGEGLSFTPWHTITAHEPLGEINRIRKDVYSKLSRLRHRLNGVEEREPQPTDPDPAQSPPPRGNDSSAFSKVLEDELDLIEERRRHVEGPHADPGTGNQGCPRPERATTIRYQEYRLQKGLGL